jgi:cytochrome c1
MTAPRPLAASVLALLAALTLAACGREAARSERNDFGGDPDRGLAAIGRTQCGACHVIPGVPDAHGLVGPPLSGFGQRTMIAGLLPNTPDNLVRWIRDPQSVAPGNAMPSSGLTDGEARDVAAYLYTLK